jgi:hypothetical protein
MGETPDATDVATLLLSRLVREQRDSRTAR